MTTVVPTMTTVVTTKDEDDHAPTPTNHPTREPTADSDGEDNDDAYDRGKITTVMVAMK